MLGPCREPSSDDSLSCASLPYIGSVKSPIFIAFAMQFVLVTFMFYERQHENREAIKCGSIVEVMCRPKEVSEKPWYTTATAMEDPMFELQVALLTAAFSGKKEEPAVEEATKN